ncbi:S1 family peptidase [Streptomyces aureoverticillatus]|uniref:S1 family peptidase n=1 Tax=Streptomyces aureoverticillatus TaxID=66871 RepID=UPI0013DB7D52|nr:S1 family peptidase [Streptomyces aureoverticillatus]QIB41915.1 streptogrisin B precursor [Streptomyces aureoverticillatus]
MRLRTILAQVLTVVLATLALLTAPTGVAAAAGNAAAGVIRGGDQLFSAGGRCAVSFNTMKGTQFYGIMPGHCATVGTTWFADPGLTVPVGVTETSVFPGNDYALIRYTNTSYSYPSEVAAGAQSFRIDRAARPTVGQRVCHVGRTSGLHCGVVQSVNNSISFPQGVVSGLFRSNLCAEPGDTGAPAFGGNAALGLGVGGSGNCSSGGTTFHQPVAPVLEAHGLRVGY